MQFIKRLIEPSVVEAEQYHLGLEDGFSVRYQDVKRPECNWGIRSSPYQKPVQVPFIKVGGKPKFLKSSDWIVFYSNGRRAVLPDKEFQKKYKKLEE